ncbi:MAG: hypothetical protein ACU0C9_09935, partial [Paracoccaceae bacterium]
ELRRLSWKCGICMRFESGVVQKLRLGNPELTHGVCSTDTPYTNEKPNGAPEEWPHVTEHTKCNEFLPK